MITYYQKPNRFDSVKDEAYDLQYAKSILYKLDKFAYNVNAMRSIINWQFYRGDQWTYQEDLDAFLMDESGEPRNRIKFVNNIIRPRVEYWRGATIRMDINFSAYSVSRESKDRRDDALGKLKMIEQKAKEHPELADALKEKFAIKDTPEETEQSFINMYRDKYEEITNNFLHQVEDRNDFEDIKVRICKNVVLDGIGITKEEERFGEQYWEVLSIRNFFFDTGAKRPDLKDAEYMGDFEMMSKVEIYEKYQNLSQKSRELIEKVKGYASYATPLPAGLHTGFQFIWQDGDYRLPVYKVYWRDITNDTWGAVIDENGYVSLELINGESNYTTKDLIPLKDLENLKKEYSWIEKALTVNGKQVNCKVIPLDTCRYCHFIPMEYVDGATEDIILGHGIRDYQTKYSYKKKFTEFPYKVYCWSYDNGNILSPIDDLISPQRYLNRVLSMAEGQINNSRGSGSVFNMEKTDMTEEELLRNVNLNKPILMNGDVNNSVGSYDSTIKDGTFKLFNIAEIMNKMAGEMIGGGEALSGSGGAYRVTGAAAQQNLNQGTIMQEPVFYAINKIIEQSCESIANRGRRIYSANKKVLTEMVGDEGYEDLFFSKDYDSEEYRISFKRINDPESEINGANELLLQLKQANLIDDLRFAQYFGKSDLNQVGKAVREFTYDKIEKDKLLLKQQEKEKQNNIQAQKQEEMQGALNQDQAVQLDQQNKEREASVKLQSEMIKNNSKNNLQVQ